MKRSFLAEAAAFLFAIAAGAVIVEQFMEAIVLESQLRAAGLL